MVSLINMTRILRADKHQKRSRLCSLAAAASESQIGQVYDLQVQFQVNRDLYYLSQIRNQSFHARQYIVRRITRKSPSTDTAQIDPVIYKYGSTSHCQRGDECTQPFICS